MLLASTLPQIGLWLFTTSTWITYGDQKGFWPNTQSNSSTLAFHKPLTLSAYGQWLGLSTGLNIPWHYTVDARNSPTESRSALGDFSAYLGNPMSWTRLRFEPRLGVITPMGYNRHEGSPWIGPGNTRLTVGVAFNDRIRPDSPRWEQSVESQFAYALNSGIAKSGSWELGGNAKVTFRPSYAYRLGLENTGWIKRSFWGNSATLAEALGINDAPADEVKMGCMLTAFGERFISRSTALGLKAGHTLWAHHDAAAFQLAFSLLWYPG